MIDQIHLMRIFVAVEEEGGFAAAARKLDISSATVTRAIVALEKFLNARLVVRTTRLVKLTDAGLQYFVDAKEILKSIEEANQAVSDINTIPHGTLTITAPVLFGRLYVMPCVIKYMQQNPNVKVIAKFADDISNLVEEGIDVAIRIGELPNSTLRAIKVGQVRRVLCASPNYLSTVGTPRSPSDLLKHSIIASNTLSSRTEWKFCCGTDQEKIRIDPRLSVLNNDAGLFAALGGLGIASLLSYQVKGEVENGNLTLLLEEYEEHPWPIHVVHREGKLSSTKVRNFIELIVDHLRKHPNI